MTDEEFVLDNKKKVVVRKRISYLNKGDKMTILFYIIDHTIYYHNTFKR